VEEEEAATEAGNVRGKMIGSIKAGSGCRRQRDITKYLTKFVATTQFLLCLQSVNC